MRFRMRKEKQNSVLPRTPSQSIRVTTLHEQAPLPLLLLSIYLSFLPEPWPATIVRAFVYVLFILGPHPCFTLWTQPRAGQKGKPKPVLLQCSPSQSQTSNTGLQVSPFRNRILA